MARLVSHDFRLIDQVARDIWVCEDKTVRPGTRTFVSTRNTCLKAEREAKERKLAKVEIIRRRSYKIDHLNDI